MDERSIHLLGRWRNGDEAAAAEIFDRYVARLMGLARTRLSAKLRRRVDEEDVVQSAYRSFFRKARTDDIVLKRSGDLWRLLAAITVNKAKQQAEHHRAQKRDIAQEASWTAAGDTWRSVAPQAVACEPTPDAAVAVVEELERLMAGLNERDRQALELRLQGEGVPEIAVALDVAEMTVRRILNRCGESLQKRLRRPGETP